MVVDLWDWMAICPAQRTSACDIEFHVGFHSIREDDFNDF